MKKLFIVAILSVGIISGLVISPEIWAIVEPHIIINMDPGQTTKPFVINDSLGSEVFSINPSGVISPAVGTITPLQFAFQSPNGVDLTVTSGETEVSPQFLLRFDTVNPDLSAVAFIRGDSSVIILEAKRDSGSGTCKIGWVRSTNGGSTYTDIGSEVGTTSASYTGIQDTSTFLILEDNTTNFGLGIYSSDGSTNCSYQNIVAFTEFYFVEGWTVTQVIP